MDISLCSLNYQTKVLQWSGANNPLWLIRHNELIEFSPDKQPIGKYSGQHLFTNHEISLMKGDLIYVFTDGFADQFGGEKGKKFKSSKLKELFLQLQAIPITLQKSELNTAFEKWKGNLEQVDDVCVIGVKI
jgi:serine phosphatase RsbU (regulator of sigma subunit)